MILMDKIMGWNIDKVCALFACVNSKKQGKILSAFEEFAIQYNCGLFSVRNFYYKIIRLTKTDKCLRDSLTERGVVFKKTSRFSPSSERELLRALLVDNGLSVRATCLKLAKGDKILAMRYQNKYRNSVKYNSRLLEEVSQEIRDSGGRLRGYQSSKIIKMPTKSDTQNYITDAEIQSLFLGLVRLVKKSSEQALIDRQNYQFSLQNSRIEKAELDNKKMTALIKELREQNKALKEKLLKSQKREQNNLVYYQKINTLISENKMAKLRDFVAELSKNEQKSNKKS